MKILFVGVFYTEWSTHHPMVKELRKQNHQVIRFDFRYLASKFQKVKHPLYLKGFKKYYDRLLKSRIQIPQKIRSLKFHLFGNHKMNHYLVEIVKNDNFDLVFFCKADTVNYDLIKIINKYAKTWYYFMDPFIIFNQIEAYKYAKLCNWSSASVSNLNELFRKNGANSFFMTQGLNPDVFKKNTKDMSKKIDVIFIGTATPKRKNAIQFLEKNEIKVICFGNGWKNEPIYLEELVEKYQKSKIILNFTKEKVGFSIRNFQAMGTGSFLLSEYCLDLEEIFKKGEHLDWFKSEKELVELINYYLENEVIRENIAKEGNKYVRENFSWEKIMKSIIHIVQGENI
jgi:spore maturation protein CgeB